MESDCTLRFGFNALTKSILYTKQRNLFLHLLSTLKHFLSVSLKQQTLVKEQQTYISIHQIYIKRTLLIDFKILIQIMLLGPTNYCS